MLVHCLRKDFVEVIIDHFKQTFGRIVHFERTHEERSGKKSCCTFWQTYLCSFVLASACLQLLKNNDLALRARSLFLRRPRGSGIILYVYTTLFGNQLTCFMPCFTVCDKCRLQTCTFLVYIVLPLLLLRANCKQANQNAIQANRSAIQANRSAIQANQNAIQANRSAIQASQNAIQANRSAIQANRNVI